MPLFVPSRSLAARAGDRNRVAGGWSDSVKLDKIRSTSGYPVILPQ
jgi:hypothetical protein